MADKYNSRIAGFLGKLNGSKAHFAITISSTCTLYSCEQRTVDANTTGWRKHEDCHKEQIKHEGWLLFMVKYFWWNIAKGYTNNPYEVLAREAQLQ